MEDYQGRTRVRARASAQAGRQGKSEGAGEGEGEEGGGAAYEVDLTLLERICPACQQRVAAVGE